MIFCYGDSLTFGWVPNDNNPHPYGPHLEAELNALYSSASAKSAEETGIPATIVQSVGYPGMTAAAMLELIEQDQVGTCSIVKQVTNLSVMIILTGTNDLGQMTHDAIGQDPSTIDSDGTSNMIINFITKLHKKTLDCAESVGNKDLHILSIGIPGSDLQTKYPQVGSIAAAVNKGLSEFASSYPNGKIIYRDFPFEFEESDSKWGGDGLHLSSLGYDELGEALAPEVKRILDIMYDV